MRPTRPAALSFLVAVPQLLTGCQTMTPKAPAWEPETPLLVREVLVTPVDVAPGALTHSSAEALTTLLIDSLKTRGLDARPYAGRSNEPAVILSCRVPALAMERRGRFRPQTTYRAELACAVKDQTTEDVRWERALEQRYEETVVFNTMTKRASRYAEILHHECVLPLWDAMAYAVKLYLKRPPLPAPDMVTQPDLSTDLFRK